MHARPKAWTFTIKEINVSDYFVERRQIPVDKATGSELLNKCIKGKTCDGGTMLTSPWGGGGGGACWWGGGRCAGQYMGQGFGRPALRNKGQREHLSAGKKTRHGGLGTSLKHPSGYN